MPAFRKKASSPAASPARASLVKQLVSEINTHGANIRTVARKKTFAATSAAAKKTQVSRAVSARVTKKAVWRGVDAGQRGLHTAIQAEIRKRLVGCAIRSLGPSPMARVCTANVRKGINNKLLQANATVHPRLDPKQNPKRIADELKKVRTLKPSQIRSKIIAKPALTTVNTEILKRAVILQVLQTVAKHPAEPIKPTKSTSASSKQSSPCSPSKSSSPKLGAKPALAKTTKKTKSSKGQPKKK